MRDVWRYQRESPRDRVREALALVDELAGLDEEVAMALYEHQEYEKDCLFSLVESST